MKRVIVMGRRSTTWRIALWAAVPVGQESGYAAPGATSQWSGASAAENLAIAEGRVVEDIREHSWSADFTNAQKRQVLQGEWQAFQADINVRVIGAYWDENGWTVAP